MQREKRANCIDRYGTKLCFLWREFNSMGSLEPPQIKFFEFLGFGGNRPILILLNADKNALDTGNI